MRIDAHQHFWKFSKKQFGWFGENMKELMKDHLPSDLKPLMEENRIDGSISVQLNHSEEENNYLLGLADQHEWIKGVVGWLDLSQEGIRSRLEKLSKNPKFKGLRHNFQHERNPASLIDYTFNKGVSYMKDYDLVFEILIHQGQMDYADEFIKRHPYTRLIINDVAKPLVKTGEIEPWASKLQRMAHSENLYCKISGLITLADRNKWKEKDFRPYLDIALEAFGPDRILFGSDWPICTVAAPYSKSVGIIEKYIKTLSKDEQALIMGKNAELVYNIST